jgi:glucose/mannose-6-phosphate isomerase
VRNVSLDDAAALRAGDGGGMLELVASLGTQLRDGFETARTTAALPSAEGIRAVVVSGMGGSGVAGDVLRSVYGSSLALPVNVVKGYQLPAFCGADTVVLATSFSGQTEETLATYTEAVARGCRVVAISSGGELAALAEGDGVPHVPIPSSIRAPRAALGALAAAPLGVLSAVGLLPSVQSDVAEAAALLEEFAEPLGPDRATEGNEAKAVARWLGPRVPVVWGSEGIAEAAALRWKTQFNENAKVPAFSSALPELDHNEVEGWSESSGEAFAVVVLRHGGEHARVAARLTATAEALRGSGLAFREVHAPKGGPLASLFALAMTGDFASTYAALARGVDPSPVPVLSALKERLTW